MFRELHVFAESMFWVLWLQVTFIAKEIWHKNLSAQITSGKSVSTQHLVMPKQRGSKQTVFHAQG